VQQLALFAFVAFILWLFARDIKRRSGLSPALWIVLVWVVIIGSRAVSTWFEVGREAESVNAYDEGNPLERNVYFVLLVSGLVTLFRRGVRFDQLLRYNKWLAAFFIFWLLSVLWADLPFVAFKRWVKDTGNLIMVLVILTERDPIEAAKAIFVRCACLLIPLSVLFVRYYSELGRAYHAPTGEMMFTGVATHKNTLGALVMVGGLFLVWDLTARFHKEKRIRWIHFLPDFILMAMAVWLLVKSHSATSLACAFVGVAIFIGLRAPAVKARLGRLELYALAGGVIYWALNSMFDVTRFVVEDLLGRDMGLTTRTEVWPVLLSQADSPILGAGFMSFWSGERLTLLFEKYSIIQAHNGYLEVYLNGGWVAILLLVALLIAASQTIKRDLLRGNDFAIVRFMLLVIAIIHNFTEASISKGGLVWFVLLLAVARYPRIEMHRARARKPRPEAYFDPGTVPVTNN
jgi:exopolysaccharide production protein ExoQ